jgi:PEP-CTERM motif
MKGEMLMMRMSMLAVQVPLFLVLAGAAVAGPVTIDFTLTATEGSQFGVTAPAAITGAFVVDSSFLAQANGSYDGGAISDFLMQIGTQVYDQTTAFSPDIQGIELQSHEIVGVAMNWEQTSAGLGGPFTQWAEDGTWFAGSTADQPGDAILHGPAGSQSFTNTAVPEPSTWAMMMLGFAGLAYGAFKRGQKNSATAVA